MPARSGESGTLVGIFGSVIFDGVNCPAASVTIQSVTIADALPGDSIQLVPPGAGPGAGLALAAGYCNVAGVALIPFVNPTAAGVDPASLTYTFQIRRPN